MSTIITGTELSVASVNFTEKVSTTIANTFTAPQRAAITAEDNTIDFTAGNNFSLTATAGLMATPVVTGCTGQSGNITIYSAENITGWDALYKFKNVPTGLTGEEVFGYFIESETQIRIGRMV
jgi:hypothetical protein